MSRDEVSAPDPNRAGERGPNHAEIEAQVCDAYGRKLEACGRLHAFGEVAFYAWTGRAVDPASVDPIILAEGARATKTYAGALRLVAGGFGPQTSMLNRSLFEGMAIAHWAHTHPDKAVELFKKHGRHSELLWGDAFEKANPDDARTIDAGTKGERQALGGLFGTYGTRLWTAHPSLYKLLPEIEDQWPQGPARKELWWYFRIAHRDNNEVLHSTALGLSRGITRSTESLGLDAGPSGRYLDRALVGTLWCYQQMLTLLWDHFAIPDRNTLDEITRSARDALKPRCDRGPTR